MVTILDEASRFGIKTVDQSIYDTSSYIPLGACLSFKFLCLISLLLPLVFLWDDITKIGVGKRLYVKFLGLRYMISMRRIQVYVTHEIFTLKA